MSVKSDAEILAAVIEAYPREVLRAALRIVVDRRKAREVVALRAGDHCLICGPSHVGRCVHLPRRRTSFKMGGT